MVQSMAYLLLAHMWYAPIPLHNIIDTKLLPLCYAKNGDNDISQIWCIYAINAHGQQWYDPWNKFIVLLALGLVVAW